MDRFHRRSLDGSLTPRMCQVSPLMCQVVCTHTIPFQPMTDQAMLYNPVCVGMKAEAGDSQILRG